jgi:hypothetical protein
MARVIASDLDTDTDTDKNRATVRDRATDTDRDMDTSTDADIDTDMDRNNVLDFANFKNCAIRNFANTKPQCLAAWQHPVESAFL